MGGRGWTAGRWAAVAAGSVAAFFGLSAARPVAGPPDQASFTFRFSAPDGLEYVQVLRTVRVQDLGALGSQTERSVARTTIRITRTAEGYTMTGRPIAFKMSRDGREVREPLAEALQGVEITYHLDPEGKLLRLEGFEGLLDTVTDKMPMQAASLASLLDAKTLTDREAAEWNGRIGGFIGRTVRIGDVWHDRAPFVLPTGEDLEYFSATSFPRVEACGQATCLLVEISYSTDPTTLEDRAPGAPGAAPGKAAGPVAASGAEVSGAAHRLIEPGTMRIHSESTSRTVRMNIELPGRGSVPMTLTETRDYSFEY